LCLLQSPCQRSGSRAARLSAGGSAVNIARLLRAIEQQQVAVLFFGPVNTCQGSLAKWAANTSLVADTMLAFAKRLCPADCTAVLLGHSSGERVRYQQDGPYEQQRARRRTPEPGHGGWHGQTGDGHNGHREPRVDRR
jgi:hypothetical protein